MSKNRHYIVVIKDKPTQVSLRRRQVFAQTLPNI